jgi:hypothetical protein
MEWVIPVVAVVGTTQLKLRVIVEDGDVVVVGPQSPYIVPPSSIEVYVDALQAADDVARGMGRLL